MKTFVKVVVSAPDRNTYAEVMQSQYTYAAGYGYADACEACAKACEEIGASADMDDGIAQVYADACRALNDTHIAEVEAEMKRLRGLLEDVRAASCAACLIADDRNACIAEVGAEMKRLRGLLEDVRAASCAACLIADDTTQHIKKEMGK